MVEPPITATQRAYLGAFDEWLRNPTPGATLERERSLSAVCTEGTVQPTRQPEQREDEKRIRMNDQRPAPRTTRVVLSEALAELKDRQARLAKLTAEIAEIRAAIKALEKLLPRSTVVAQQGTPRDSAAAPRLGASETDEAVLRAITDHQPVSSGKLALQTGLDIGAVRASVKRLREGDKVSMVGDKASARYVIPTDADRSEAA